MPHDTAGGSRQQKYTAASAGFQEIRLFAQQRHMRLQRAAQEALDGAARDSLPEDLRADAAATARRLLREAWKLRAWI